MKMNFQWSPTKRRTRRVLTRVFWATVRGNFFTEATKRVPSDGCFFCAFPVVFRVIGGVVVWGGVVVVVGTVERVFERER